MNTPIYPCLGALVGDTVGSVYEFNNIKTTKFPLFSGSSSPTDDSVMTMAIADWLANTDRSEEQLIESMLKWGNQFQGAGYGGGFCSWLFYPEGLRDYRGNSRPFLMPTSSLITSRSLKKMHETVETFETFETFDHNCLNCLNLMQIFACQSCQFCQFGVNLFRKICTGKSGINGRN